MRIADLIESGLRVVVVWECETEDPAKLHAALSPLLEHRTV
jgi:G:T-mismatch repair DNA endonuclease (very short patch repair protein)